MSARKSQEPIIVIGFGSKIAGWVGVPGGRLMGDPDVVKAARLAAADQMEISMYRNLFTTKADISNPKNLLGVFAAFYAYDDARIRLLKAPQELWDQLGFIPTKEQVFQPAPSTSVYVIDGEKYEVPYVQV